MDRKVRITWNGMGGELDSVIVEDNGRIAGERAIKDALVEMIGSGIVAVGDSFTVREVE